MSGSDTDRPEEGEAETEEAPREGLLATVREFSKLWGFALFLLLILALFHGVVLPFVFGALIAYMLEPVVRRLAPAIGRFGAVGVVYLVLFAMLAGFFGGLLPRVVTDLSALRDSTPEAVATFNEEWLPKASAWFERTFPGLLPGSTADDVAQEVGAAAGASRDPGLSEVVVEPRADGSFRVDLSEAHLEVREQGGGWVIEADPPKQDSLSDIIREIVASKGDELTDLAAAGVRGFISGVANFLADFILAFLIAAFVLVDTQRIGRFARSLVPEVYLGEFEDLAAGIDEGMAGVARGQILICVINGTLTYIGLLIFGVHYSLLLAMVAAMLSIIPVAGILIATIPVMGVALLSGDLGLEAGLAFGKSAAVLGWLVGIHLLETNYLNPKIIGIASNIHPVVLIFALLAGLDVGGLLGAVLAIPVASVFQTVFLYLRRRSGKFERSKPTRERKRNTGGWSTISSASTSRSSPVDPDLEPEPSQHD